ncbi:MAG: BolA/IbaG family iron-sulfur metabolism protein [Pseudomonadales bacterium]|jgi:acid stress-induced BolA-like protein IbaG/YrbA
MKDTIVSALAAAFPDAEIGVELAGNRAELTIVSGAFAGLSRVRRQQAVYGCIQQFIADGSLHAVTMRVLSPDEARSG